MIQGLKDFTAGVICGWTQVIIMQPFEIVKIRMQTQSVTNPQYKGPIDCLKNIISKEGLLALYKGTLAPLLGIGTQISFLFGTNQAIKRFLGKYNSQGPNQPLDYKLVGLSGWLAGVPSAFFASPIEHVRIRIQILKNLTNSPYAGSVGAAKYTVKNYGLKTLFLGFFATYMRESVGNTTYFLGYEATKRQFLQPGQTQPKRAILVYLLSGSVAGISFWLFAYPFDCLKTLMQTDSLDPKQRKYNGFFDTYRKFTTQNGFKSLYRGFSVAMARAVPVNAGAFLAFELSLDALGRKQKS